MKRLFYRLLFCLPIALVTLVSCRYGQPVVGIIVPDGQPLPQEYAVLKAMAGSRASVRLVHFGNLERLKGCDAVWIHSSDTSVVAGEKAAAPYFIDYVESGGRLVLSMEAVRLLNEWGIEPEPVDIWEYEAADEGFGRKFGFHSFRYHPLFEGMNGGAYPWHGKEDNICRVLGYDGDRLPSAEGASVIATQWEYIFNRPEKKVLWQTPVGKGYVLSIGCALYYGKENFHEEELRGFTGNCIDYVTGRLGFSGKPRFWTYGEADVIPLHSVHDEPCRICAAEYRPVSPAYPAKRDLPQTGYSLSRQAVPGSYIDVASPHSLVVASEEGGIDEIWTHPFMSLRDWRVYLDIDGQDELVPLSGQSPSVEIHPHAAVRRYDVCGIELTETIAVSVSAPLTSVHYEWSGKGLRRIVTDFRCNLRYMWPYDESALGSLYYGWSPELNGFVVRDGEREFVSLAGANVPGHLMAAGRYGGFSYAGKKVNGVPSDLLQAAASVMYELDGIDAIDFVMAASNTGDESLLCEYAGALREPEKIAREAAGYWKCYMDGIVEVTTPDAGLNEALRWAQISSAQFIAETPGIGRSLMAGYSSSRRGWGGGHRVSGRPGYAWYFGRDSEWAGFAFADMGDLGTVRDILGMLIRFQQSDGKIFHELTTSGFVHYDASDATPLFVCLMAHYLRASGDIGFVMENIGSVERAISYCRSTDTDGDGLIEISNVGHGWLEGGTLFGAQTEFYLCGVWKAALEDASWLMARCGKKALAHSYAAEAKRMTPALEAFWNGNDHYRYALDADGTYREDFVTLVSVPVLLGVVDGDRATAMMRLFQDPEVTADWGVRTVPESSEIDDSGAYSPRNVWPLFTGWKSLADYATGYYEQGFSAFAGSLMTYRGLALGRIAEVINGDVFKNNGITLHQCWSETMAIMPLIEGMLGFRPDATVSGCRLSPRIPSGWDSFSVKNLRIGECRLSVDMQADEHKVLYTLSASGSPAPLTLDFSPSFAPGTVVTGVKVEGKPVRYMISDDGRHVSVSLSCKLKGSMAIEVERTGGISVILPVASPQYGAASTGFRLIDQVIRDGILRVTLSGRSGQSCLLDVVENGALHEMEVQFPETDSAYAIKTIDIPAGRDI